VVAGSLGCQQIGSDLDEYGGLEVVQAKRLKELMEVSCPWLSGRDVGS
jgi:hypothetical protein